jgi:predicted RNA binding protein YcfA (HicA-like mRNA interferase family)
MGSAREVIAALARDGFYFIRLGGGVTMAPPFT